ncbi:hypothetical protein IFM89_017614 [Coptis chinensis]|uniref:Uncharacterized protein n=1 Tax=Coptis chinensis TaxID=261450 RepID=A0A835GWQ9_9MAGN|nr:hypothetical protein IFM89_017614 [Coptis chinensis]
MLEEKIEDVKRCDAFPGQSERTESGKWVGVAQTLHTLRNVVNTFCMRVENLVCLSKPSLCEWRDQRKFEDDIEVMVIRNSIRGFLEDFEINSWKQGPQLSGSQYTNQLAKINQLSSLRQELDIISRTLSSPEMGQFPLNGSDESGEQCTNGKRKDHFLRKAFSSDISQFIKEANGKNQESKTDLSETMESASLKHMTKDEIVSFFKSEITRMKRNHESQVQEITEEYFRLRREFLKESGPLSSLRKDKEFEAFRKKIPELMVKLDDVLFKNEKLSVLYGNNEIICNLKNRIDTLLSENQQMKGLLTSKSKEVKHLSSQLSSAADKISQHFVTEANLLKRIRKLKCDMQDMSLKLRSEKMWISVFSRN